MADRLHAGDTLMGKGSTRRPGDEDKIRKELERIFPKPQPKPSLWLALLLALFTTCASPQLALAQWGRTATFGGALGAGVLANAIWKFDRDAGGYHDSAHGIDKVAHALASYVIEDACEDVGAHPLACLGMTIGTGVAFEFSQGYVSRWDIRFDALGASASWALRRVFRR